MVFNTVLTRKVTRYVVNNAVLTTKEAQSENSDDILLISDMFLRVLNWSWILLFFVGCADTEPTVAIEEKLLFYGVETNWADSTLDQLSLEEKLNQLILIESDWLDTAFVSREYAGVILNGNKEALITASNLNRNQDLPSFIGSGDLEFAGLSAAPNVQTLNIFGLSKETLDSTLSIERALKKYLGINFSYTNGTSVDSTFDPLFDSPARHARISRARMRAGLLDGIIHVVGSIHFPVNDTTPVCSNNQKENEFIGSLIDSGLISIGLDNSSFNEGMSLASGKKMVMNQLDYGGLIVSAPIELSDSNGIENAFSLGADLIRVPAKDSARIGRFKQKLTEKIANNKMGVSEINRRVRKTLIAKTWMRKNSDSVSMQDYLKQFYIPTKGIAQQIKKEAIVLLQNRKNRIPITDIAEEKTCFIKYGKSKYGGLLDQLNKYEKVWYQRAKQGRLNPNHYRSYGKLVLLVEQKLDSANSKDLIAITKLEESHDLIIVNVGNPENLNFLENFSTLIQVVSGKLVDPQNLAEAIYGGIAIGGCLPEAYGVFPVCHGLRSEKTRLEYALPEEAGIHSDSLLAIRSIAREMVFSNAAPGCQIMAIKKGKIIYHKSFGHHTYDKIIPVINTDVYDLASLTKILSTTPAFMNFYEQKTFLLEDSLGKHLPDSLIRILGKKSAFQNIAFRELLEHKSGAASGLRLKSYIEYQNDSVGKWDKYYCDQKNEDYNIMLAENFYMDRDQLDSLWFMMNSVALDPDKPYKYSDINMNMIYMLMRGKIPAGQSYSRYMDSMFYKPMGLATMCFHPLQKLDSAVNRIAPTEYDTYWRGTVLKGFVHDPTAALFGGEAGSAGLFASAEDVGVFCQMLLNGGKYGGRRFFKSATVKLFTDVQPFSARGLGFDKPTGKRSSTKATSCPIEAYGHTGFTGICAWVDPVNELIFVFCSNRVHPSSLNNKINTSSIRSRIHQVFYDQILEGSEITDSLLSE